MLLSMPASPRPASLRRPAGLRPPDPFVAHLLELLEPMGGVTARVMFGGVGFFRRGVMFALVWGGTFYVRVDETTRPAHEARGLGPFEYDTRAGKRKTMPYFQVPPEALEDADEMARWAAPAARGAEAKGGRAARRGAAAKRGRPATRGAAAKRARPPRG
jgi:DNA transformation protein